MSARSDRAPLLAVLAIGLSMVGGIAGAAEPVYTDVAACRSADLGPDEFVRHCKGPKGYAATLYYFDGRAVPAFGKAKPGAPDEFDLGSVEVEPIEIGIGSPFGKKIEWVMADGEPCAAILRIGTSKGDRLTVSSLDGTSTRLGMAKTNEEARRIAAKACKVRVLQKGGERTRKTESQVPVPQATGRPKVGDYLMACSKCPGATITRVSGEPGSPSVTARVSRADAEQHCSAWSSGDPKRDAQCVVDLLDEDANREFGASATCSKLEIVSYGTPYRYDGPGKDEFGDLTSQWLNLSTGQRAELSSAGDRRTVANQFETLCPGIL